MLGLALIRPDVRIPAWLLRGPLHCAALCCSADWSTRVIWLSCLGSSAAGKILETGASEAGEWKKKANPAFETVEETNINGYDSEVLMIYEVYNLLANGDCLQEPYSVIWYIY